MLCSTTPFDDNDSDDDHGDANRPSRKRKVTKRLKHDWNSVEYLLGVNRKRGINASVYLYENDFYHLSTKKVRETAKNNVKKSYRPDVSIGVISGAVQLANTIKEGNVEPYADGGALNATAGSVSNILGGETVYARASVAEGRVGFGDVASIGASTLSAGAHAEYGWTNSVGAYASLARVDGNVGPIQVGVGLNLDTHASIGANGVSASVLGFGINIGPRIGIRTPFFDFNISLF